MNPPARNPSRLIKVKPPAEEFTQRGSCTASTRELLESVIDGQAQSLTAGNLEGAYAFASPSFRDQVSLDVFEQIIGSQYRMLVSYQGASFGQCEEQPGSIAVIGVTFQSGEFQPVQMVYQMVFEDGQWRVNGVDVPVSAVPNA